MKKWDAWEAKFEKKHPFIYEGLRLLMAATMFALSLIAVLMFWAMS